MRVRYSAVPMAAERIATDVLIAGGGPVGLVAAIELARRGVGAILLNDKPETATHPKANAIGARSMEHFRRLGVARRIRGAGLDDDHPTDVSYFTSLTGIELARLRMPCRSEILRMARAGEGPWPTPEPPHRCSQIFLERALRERAAEVGAELRFGWRLDSFREEKGGVAATAEEIPSGRRAEIAARYLIGCDGGASIVRRALGIELEGERGVVRPMMGGSMHSAYFRARLDASWLRVGKSWQYWVVNPDIRSLIIHVDSRDLFLIQVPVPEGVDRRAVDSRDLLHRSARANFPMEILSTVPWTAGHSLVAQRYRAGRVFLAGDSAHLFTPTGGLGMNTGVDDAVNLAWKLAAAIRGWGGDALLASYEAERRPIGIRNVAYAATMATSVGTVPVTKAVDDDTAAGREERARLGAYLADHAFREFIIPGIQLGLRYAGSPIVVADGAAFPEDTPNSFAQAASPGMRAPHLWLGEDALYDRFGPEFTLLRFAGSTKGDAIRAAAARHGVPLSVVDVPGDRARDLYGADLALIRPDQHVAWRGNADPKDAIAVIDIARGA